MAYVVVSDMMAMATKVSMTEVSSVGGVVELDEGCGGVGEEGPRLQSGPKRCTVVEGVAEHSSAQSYEHLQGNMDNGQ